VDAARRILGMALGMAPKNKTFKSYIEMELALGHVDRWTAARGSHFAANFDLPTAACLFGSM